MIVRNDQADATELVAGNGNLTAPYSSGCNQPTPEPVLVEGKTQSRPASVRGKCRMVFRNPPWAGSGARGRGSRTEDRGKPELRGPHRPAPEPVMTHVPRENNRIPDYTIAKPGRVAGLHHRLLNLLRGNGGWPCRPAHQRTGLHLRPSAGTHTVMPLREVA